MTDYIKREDALKAVDAFIGTDPIADRIKLIPSADVVPVVRCKDCFLYGECKLAEFIGDDGYCSCGKERQ